MNFSFLSLPSEAVSVFDKDGNQKVGAVCLSILEREESEKGMAFALYSIFDV